MAAEWFEWINQQRAQQQPADVVWRDLVAQRPNGLTASAWVPLWQHCFRDWPREQMGPPPIWIPTSTEIQQTNIGRWLRDRDLKSWQEWHRWSIANREDYWSEIVTRLNIQFAQRPQRTLDASRGPEFPQWLVGASWNIAASCFQGSPDRVAIISGRPRQPLRNTTLGELADQVQQIAASIRAQGFAPGDRLAVVLPMTAEAVAIYLGIVWAGCAVVSIADSFAEPEIANRLRIAEAKAVFTYDTQTRGGKTLPLYERVQRATQLPIIVLPEGLTGVTAQRSQDLTWSQFLRSERMKSPVCASSETIINVLFSSGTTGDPKAIPWTQLTPLKCAADGYIHQDIQPGHVCCWPTNLGWMMGPFLIFATLINRGTIGLFEDAPVGEEFGRFIQDARVNMLGVIPTIVKTWRASRSMESFDWSSIHCFSSTGESSQPDDMVYLSSLAGMRPVIEYCGGTEIGGGYITSTLVQPNVPSAFSTAAAGIDFVLLDEFGKLSDAGELFLVPPSIGLSQSLLNRDHHETYYADVPSVASLNCLRRHGDFMQQLPGGYWVAGGRVDDTMNLGGIKISSAEIERVLNEVPGVRETAAIGWSTGGPEELVVFAVCLTSWDPLQLRNAFNQQLKTKLNPLFRASQVQIVEALPRTASNKVMRRELRKSLQTNG